MQLDVAALAPPGGPLPSLNDVAGSQGLAVSQLLDLNPSLSGSDPSAPLPGAFTLRAHAHARDDGGSGVETITWPRTAWATPGNQSRR